MNTGEFESEICIPVRVRYEVTTSAEGERIELAHANSMTSSAVISWPHIPLRERRALEKEALAHWHGTKDGKETP